MFACRQERFAKGIVKIIPAAEILAAVSVGFGEQAAFNHVENDLAEILAFVNAPFLKEGDGHGTELSESEIADTSEKFLAADVRAFAPLAEDGFLREIKRLADKEVGIARVAGILRDDQIETFFEAGFVHFSVRLNRPLPEWAGARRGGLGAPSRRGAMPPLRRAIIVPAG